jgi:hypothetical protein
MKVSNELNVKISQANKVEKGFENMHNDTLLSSTSLHHTVGIGVQSGSEYVWNMSGLG